MKKPHQNKKRQHKRVSDGGKSAPPSPCSTPVERIFIGGIDAPLTPQAVAARLQSTPGIRTLNVDYGPSDRYFFADIQRTEKPKKRVVVPDENQEKKFQPTAFDVVSRQYNNVRWRGCVIRVDRPRPHFLERLRLEREETKREREKELEIEEGISDPQIDDSDRAGTVTAVETEAGEEEVGAPRRKNPLGRVLRVREKYGDEAWHVDPRPREVVNFMHFGKCMSQMRKVRQKEQQEALEKRRLLKYAKTPEDIKKANKKVQHRATHLRFSEDNLGEPRFNNNKVFSESTSVNVQKMEETEPEIEKVVDKERSVQTKNDVPDVGKVSGHAGSTEAIERKQLKRSNYVWSDDEDSGAEEEETDGYFETAASDPNKDETDTSHDLDVKDDVQSNLDILSQLFPGIVVKSRIAMEENVIEESASGSDEEECESEEEIDDSKTKKVESKVDKIVSKENVNDSIPNDLDLQRESQSSLDILSQLFPGMESKQNDSLDQEETNLNKEEIAEVASSSESSEGKSQPESDSDDDLDEEESDDEDYNDGGDDNDGEDDSDDEDYDDEDDDTDSAAETATEEIPCEIQGEEKESLDKNAAAGPSIAIIETDNEKMKETTMTGTVPEENLDSEQIVKGTKEKAAIMKKNDNGDEQKEPKADIYEQNKLESIFKNNKQTLVGEDASPTVANKGFQLSQLFQDQLVEEKDDTLNEELSPKEVVGDSEQKQIYEQTKLENVFRDAKETGGFKFGDLIGIESKPNDENKTAVQPPPSALITAEQNAPQEEQAQTDRYSFSITRQKGLYLNKQLLDKLEENFFSMQDLGGVENILQESSSAANLKKGDDYSDWQDERLRLTLDWKRKAKQALERKQKKIRI